MMRLSISLMSYPSTIANFGIKSTNKAFLIRAALADVFRIFDVIFLKLTQIYVTQFGRMLTTDRFVILQIDGENINSLNCF